MADVHAHYFTDPACPWSWSLEPAIRRLQTEFGGEVHFTYVMGGIRQFEAPSQYALEWLEAGAASGMPVDPRPWLADDPLQTSYPACLAVKAAAEQGDPGPYLRRLREGFAFRRQRLDTLDALVEQGREVGGLDVARLRIDLGSDAIIEAFGADVERARAAGGGDPSRRSEAHGRVALPTIEFHAADGGVHAVYGPQPYEAYRDAAQAAGATPGGDPPPSIQDALARWGALTTAELATVCRLPGPRAPAELWRLAADWVVRVERAGSGELWSLA